MKIKGTNWYTAFCDPSLKNGASKAVYGYRMPVQGKKQEEIDKMIADLKKEGVRVVSRTSQNSHVAIPAGSPFIQVLDEESAIALEQIFLKKGIEVPTDRYKEYGMEYMKRGELSRPQKQHPPKTISFWAKLFGGRNG